MGLRLDVRLPVAGLNLGLSLQALLPKDQPEQQETSCRKLFSKPWVRIILKGIHVGGAEQLSQPGCSCNAGCVCMLQVGYDPEGETSFWKMTSAAQYTHSMELKIVRTWDKSLNETC